MQYYIGNSKNHRGYVLTTEKGAYADESDKRTYEAFDVGFEAEKPLMQNLEKPHKLMGANLWPIEISNFQRDVKAFYNSLLLISQNILRLLEQKFDLETHYFDRYTQYPLAQLRLLHYLDIPEFSTISMGGHTDYELFSLIYQTGPGLQIRNKQGKWEEVDFVEKSMVLIPGDMLEILTNGYIKSTYHRVKTTGKERFSFPFFMNFDFDTVVEPLQSFVEKLNGSHYQKMQVGTHLLSQLCRDFPYFNKRYEKGDIPFDLRIDMANPFEKNKI